jgi:hypothetical protein
MPRQSVFDMKVSDVYPLLVPRRKRKAVPKPKLTKLLHKAKVDEVTSWLTVYDMATANLDVTYAEFFEKSQAYNPMAGLPVARKLDNEKIVGELSNLSVKYLG